MTVHWLDEVDSTNRAARDGDFRHGDVVASSNQTAGRGRMDRSWSMKPGGGIALTIVVSRSALGSPRHLTRLPLVVATELVRLVRSLDPTATALAVKWPNDVLVDGRKLAGILVESLDADRFGIGVGVNVTGTPPALPSDTVTSLSTMGIDIEVGEFVARFSSTVLDAVAELDRVGLMDELATVVDTIGRSVTIDLPDGSVVVGRATGLGESGSLLVHTSTGMREFVAGDVTHLRLGDADAVR